MAFNSPGEMSKKFTVILVVGIMQCKIKCILLICTGFYIEGASFACLLDVG